MLTREDTPIESPYLGLYDLIIEPTHDLRQIKELVDFSFIYDELAHTYCSIDGRPAICPIRLFKYLLLKVMSPLSDRDLVNRVKTDMAYKFFLNMAPEAGVINPSTLTVFRRQHLRDNSLLDKLIAKTIEIAREQGLIKSQTLIVDATHTKTRFNQKSPIEMLRTHSKNTRKIIYSVDVSMKDKFPTKNTTSSLEAEKTYTEHLIEVIEAEPQLMILPKVSERLNLLKESLEDINEAATYSVDTEAKVGHKSADTSFLGYKTHIGLTEERLIASAIVTTGEKADGRYLEELVEKAQEAGLTVSEIIGDTAYSGKDNIELTEKKSIELVSTLHPQISNGSRNPEEEWAFNKDADRVVCPAGHLATRKARTGKKNQGTNQVTTYYFDINRCQVCPLRDGCYKEGAKTKTYSIRIISDTHKKQLAFQETARFKERAKQRYMIEAKNGELKTRHGYDVASSVGLFGMTLQAATTLFVVNIKRILTLMGQKDQKTTKKEG